MRMGLGHAELDTGDKKKDGKKKKQQDPIYIKSFQNVQALKIHLPHPNRHSTAPLPDPDTRPNRVNKYKNS